MSFFSPKMSFSIRISSKKNKINYFRVESLQIVKKSFYTGYRERYDIPFTYSPLTLTYTHLI